MSTLPERCSEVEFDRRHRVVREAMVSGGIDALLCYGTQQGWGNVFYLTNHWDMISCYLILSARDDAILFTGTFPHFEIAKRDSIVRDVRFGGTQTLSLVTEELRKQGWDKAVLGLIEPDSFRLPGIPHRDMVRLREELPGATFVHATPMIEEIRRRKSDEEIELLREGARLTDRAFEAALDCIRPGATERDVGRAVTGSVGDAVAVLVGSTPMSNPSMPYPSTRPSARELHRGDVVLVEFSVGCAGYAGQILRTVTLGPPTERYEALYAMALKSYQGICGVLREGCTPLEIVEATSLITAAGLTTGDPLVHGFGVGIEAGLHVGPTNHPAYWPPGKFAFPARASVSIEPNPCTPDMKSGVVTGDLVIVRETGCEQLHRVPRETIIVV